MSEKPEGNGEKKESFIREYTKDKPRRKRTYVFLAVGAVVLGLLFGGAAAAAYHFGSILLTQSASADGSSADAGGAEESADAAAPEETEEEAPEEAAEEEEEEVQEFSISDYQRIQYELYSIGRTAGKSIVTVSATSVGTDLFESSYESTDQAVGLVISAEDDTLLILTLYDSLAGAEEIQVVFSDDTAAEAAIVGYDANLGLAVVSVDSTALTSSTLSVLEAAALRTTGGGTQGQVVIAVGAPLGTVYSILNGTIVSASGEVTFADGCYSVYTTSMQAADDCSGFLINTSGEVIGMMLPSCSGETLTAVSVKDLYPTISKLMAGESVAYLGVTAATITYELSQEYGLPVGIYVQEVAEDSPAYQAGIQPGDVITQIGTTEISSVDDLTEDLLTRRPDQTVTVTLMRSAGDTYTEVICSVKLGQK